MQDHNKPNRVCKTADGFATLSAAMMERNPAPQQNPAPQEKDRSARLGPGQPSAAFGLLNREPANSGERLQSRLFLAEDCSEQSAERPEGDSEPYDGPERRLKDVSPVLERRRAMPPRVRTSVRLENHRYTRLKSASVLLERTHQDLMTSALDLYLDGLGIPSLKPPVRGIKP